MRSVGRIVQATHQRHKVGQKYQNTLYLKLSYEEALELRHYSWIKQQDKP